MKRPISKVVVLAGMAVEVEDVHRLRLRREDRGGDKTVGVNCGGLAITVR